MALTFNSEIFDGTISGSFISGSVTGSFSGSINGFTGSLTNFYGQLTGYASGSYDLPVNNYVIQTIPVIKRSLLQFDLTQISKSIASSAINSPKFVLNLKVTEAKSIPLTYKVYCYPLSSSWEMGNGRFTDGGSDIGVNWMYRNYPNMTTQWYSYEDVEYVPTDDYLNTPSTSSFMRGGGVWHYALPTSSMDLPSGSSLMCTQSFEYYQTSDIELDITPICKAWIGGGILNNGLILMTSEEISTGSTNGYINFFSKETNTIYTPYIDVQWDDSTYLSGSALASSSMVPVTASIGVAVTVKNIKKDYKFGSIPRFDVYARDLYPKKSFQRLQTVYLETKYLPTSSYYAIKDNESQEMIIDFDDYTKISLDDNGNFFMLDTTGLPQERYYRILIKCEFNNGEVQIFDNDSVFKVIR